MTNAESTFEYINPMLAKTAEKPFDHPDWLFEIKLDGIRAIAELDGANVSFYNRNGLDLSAIYPNLYRQLSELNAQAVLDGEIVALDENGNPEFGLLQETESSDFVNVVYYAFDILECNGKNLRNTPLLDRKSELRSVCNNENLVRYTDFVLANGIEFFKIIQSRNLEGVIAKKINSLYLDGKRDMNWLKIRNINEQEAIIIGFSKDFSGTKSIKELILGVYDNGIIKYAGSVNRGFNQLTEKKLVSLFQNLISGHNPLNIKLGMTGNITWLKPELICNVRFLEWNRNSEMTELVFLGLRDDKSPLEVFREYPSLK